MKAIGFLLLFAGFAIVLGAIVMLSPNAPRGAFVIAGMMVQVIGLALAFRAHFSLGEGH